MNDVEAPAGTLIRPMPMLHLISRSSTARIMKLSMADYLKGSSRSGRKQAFTKIDPDTPFP